MAIAISLCAGRLVQLQGFDSAAYAATSAGQLTRTLDLLPSRGDILDRNGLVLAHTEAAVAVTADPSLTGEKAAETADILAPHLQMDKASLIKVLKTPKTRFVYVKKKVPAKTYSLLNAELREAELPGIFRQSDPVRIYPGGSVGASVIGFVGGDQGDGLAGLEYALNDRLAGSEGKETYESAPNGSKIPLGRSVTTPAENGLNFQLTLDSELQWMAERRLAEQVKETKARSGFAIVLDVKTGEVLAMANAPTFDATDPGAAPADDRGNRAVTDAYEPGSVQKVLTSAAIIDSGVATPDTPVTIPPRLPSGDKFIKDWNAHGTLQYRMRGVIAYSSNIGTTTLTRKMDTAQLHRYLASFGLGATTGIGLPGEATGILPGSDMNGPTRDRVAFGQAISVTGIQEAAAVAGVLNDGMYNPPSVVQQATNAQGEVVPLETPPARRVVSSETSRSVADLMQAVIKTPGGKKQLALTGYNGGGKTGTAELIDPRCGCYRGYVTSYLGFAPFDHPQILTYVVVTDPQRGDTGTAVAAPVYQDIMRYALPRYGVLPETGKPTKLMPLTW